MGKAHQHSVCPMAQAIRGEFQSSCVHASGFRQILEQLCVHQALKGSNCPNRHYSSWLSNIPTTKGWTTLHVNRGTAPAQSRLTGLCGWYQDLREPRSRVQSTSIWAVWKPFAPREQQESWPSLTHFRSDNCVARSHKIPQETRLQDTKGINVLNPQGPAWLLNGLCVRCQELSRWCSAQRHLDLNSFWQSLLRTTLPRPHNFFSSYQLTGDIGNHDEDPAQAPSKVEERPKV